LSARKAGWIDRALGAMGLARKPRTGQRVYAGADFSRLTQDWYTSILSADREIKGDLLRLRGASRSYARDNPYAARYARMVPENVVGHKGIDLQLQLQTTRGGPSRDAEAIEAAFKAWGKDARECSVDGRLSWVEFQQAVVRSLVVDGEALVRHWRGVGRFGYRVQLIDPDLLDVTYGNDAPVKLASGNLVALGVEVEPQFGRPVAYHLLTRHPSEFGAQRERVRIPAEELEHLYIQHRPGQTRGLPFFTPVLLQGKMAGAGEEAAVTAFRVGASSGVVIEYDAEKAGGGEQYTPGDEEPVTEIAPGMIRHLRPGESAKTLDMPYPNAEFAPFVKVIHRAIATGLNVSYTSLTGDLEAVNYSSIRAGLLSERDFYRDLQQSLITHLHERVFAEWARMAMLRAAIPTRLLDDLRAAATWQPRGWQWVDPLNDVEAASRAVREGFTTRSDICAERGADFEEILARLAEEQRLQAEYGLTLGDPREMPGGNQDTNANDDAGADDDRARRVRLLRGRGAA
jgi:lambda family phage portal protein